MKKLLQILIIILIAYLLVGCQNSLETITTLIEEGNYQQALEVYNEAENTSEVDEWITQRAEQVKNAYVSREMDFELALTRLEELSQFSGAKNAVQRTLDQVINEKNLRISQNNYQQALKQLEQGNYREAIELFDQVIESDPNWVAAQEKKIAAIDALLELLHKKTDSIYGPIDMVYGMIYVPKGYSLDRDKHCIEIWNVDKASIYPTLYYSDTDPTSAPVLWLRFIIGYVDTNFVDMERIYFNLPDRSFSWTVSDKRYEKLDGFHSEYTLRSAPGRMGWGAVIDQMLRVANSETATIVFQGKKGAVEKTITNEEKENLNLFIELYQLYRLRVDTKYKLDSR